MHPADKFADDNQHSLQPAGVSLSLSLSLSILSICLNRVKKPGRIDSFFESLTCLKMNALLSVTFTQVNDSKCESNTTQFEGVVAGGPVTKCY